MRSSGEVGGGDGVTVADAGGRCLEAAEREGDGVGGLLWGGEDECERVGQV